MNSKVMPYKYAKNTTKKNNHITTFPSAVFTFSAPSIPNKWPQGIVATRNATNAMPLNFSTSKLPFQKKNFMLKFFDSFFCTD